MKKIARINLSATGMRFVSLPDLREMLNDEGLMSDCLAMIKVGHDQGDSATKCMSQAIANFLAVAVGDLKRLEGGEVVKWKETPQ